MITDSQQLNNMEDLDVNVVNYEQKRAKNHLGIHELLEHLRKPNQPAIQEHI